MGGARQQHQGLRHACGEDNEDVGGEEGGLFFYPLGFIGKMAIVSTIESGDASLAELRSAAQHDNYDGTRNGRMPPDCMIQSIGARGISAAGAGGCVQAARRRRYVVVAKDPVFQFGFIGKMAIELTVESGDASLAELRSAAQHDNY